MKVKQSQSSGLYPHNYFIRWVSRSKIDYKGYLYFKKAETKFSRPWVNVFSQIVFASQMTIFKLSKLLQKHVISRVKKTA